ncbi:MAG: histidine--tRNA ligase [Candidatus Firestonebacteria bacterium]|nr:histidine--tRNA ligase [Candidatus Firestonebacteria bacterium]
MNLKYTSPRGTKDVLPEETAKWRYIKTVARQVLNSFGYEEIIAPMFEHTDLFTRGIGETSDIVTKEMYTFLDKKGRSLTLRPEGTAGVVRAYLQNGLYTLPAPVKLFYIGSMFRYERPQAGRYREHVQVGVEAFGSDSAYLDAEVISAVVTIFTKLGLTGLTTQLNSIGCKECRPKYTEFLREHLIKNNSGLCENCKVRAEKNPLRILDCKEESCKKIVNEGKLSKMSEYLCGNCVSHFDGLKDGLKILKVNYKLNDSLVRGFDYYTGTVFEVHSEKLGAQTAIMGGGRYNNLVDEFGGEKTPAVGFGFGLERLVSVIDALEIKLPVENTLDLFIVHLGFSAMKKALELAAELRVSGKRVQMVYEEKNIKSQMKTADALKSGLVAIIGDNELRDGVVTLKNMVNGSQKQVKFENLKTELGG